MFGQHLFWVQDWCLQRLLRGETPKNWKIDFESGFPSLELGLFVLHPAERIFFGMQPTMVIFTSSTFQMAIGSGCRATTSEWGATDAKCEAACGRLATGVWPCPSAGTDLEDAVGRVRVGPRCL